jgi:hypothetical protein
MTGVSHRVSPTVPPSTCHSSSFRLGPWCSPPCRNLAKTSISPNRVTRGTSRRSLPAALIYCGSRLARLTCPASVRHVFTTFAASTRPPSWTLVSPFTRLPSASAMIPPFFSATTPSASGRRRPTNRWRLPSRPSPRGSCENDVLWVQVGSAFALRSQQA